MALNILITGSNRGRLCQGEYGVQSLQLTSSMIIGIGKALLANYLQRPDHIIIAGLRDLSPKSCDDLRTLPCGRGSKLILLKVDSGSETDAVTAIQHLKDSYGITRLDVVIANAGISNYFGKAVVTPAAQMIEHFKINCVGPLLLFQATAALLAEAANPKFVIMSSGAASIGNMGDLKIDNTAYGASKAAANFIARKVHFENPEITAFPINPGWLQTEVRDKLLSGTPT